MVKAARYLGFYLDRASIAALNYMRGCTPVILTPRTRKNKVDAATRRRKSPVDDNKRYAAVQVEERLLFEKWK